MAHDKAIRYALEQPSGMRRTQALAAIVEDLTVDELHTLVPLLGDLPLADAAELGGMLFGRWAELNPSEAATQALAQSDATRRRQGVAGALATWAAADAAAAAAWVDTVSPGPDRDAYVTDLAGAIARSNAEAAFRRLLASPESNSSYYEMQNVVARWAERDPRSAAAAISEIKQERLREWAASALVRIWSHRDASAAWAWATGLKSGRDKTAAMQVVVTTVAESDAAEALRKTASMPEGADKQRVVVALAGGIAQTNPEQALSLVENLEPGAGQLALGAIIQTVAPTNLALAMSLFQKADPQLRQANLQSVIPFLSAKDPPAAIALLAEPATEAEFADRQIGQTLTRWMQVKADEALQWLSDHPTPNREGYFATNALAQWAAANLEQAAGWLKTKEKPPNRLVLNGLLQGIAISAPQTAAELAKSQVGTTIAPQTLGVIARSWVEKDTPAALEWMATLPEGDARIQGSAMTVGAWARTKPKEAAAWIERLPEGNLRDGSAAGYAMSVSETDPASGATWAVGIQDPKARNEALEYALSRWLRRDRAAAEAWIKQTVSIPESAKGRFLQSAR